MRFPALGATFGNAGGRGTEAESETEGKTKKWGSSSSLGCAAHHCFGITDAGGCPDARSDARYF